MNFHWPSFLLGYGAGAATVLLGKRLRPVLVEIAGTALELLDKVASRAAATREDFEDVVAEARARARAREAAAEQAKPRAERSAPSSARRAAARRAPSRARARGNRR
jgi:hypothetical protein